MLVGDASKQFKKDGDTKNHAHMEELKPYVDEIAKYANDMIDVGYIVDFDVSLLQRFFAYLAMFPILNLQTSNTSRFFFLHLYNNIQMYFIIGPRDHF